MICKRAKVLWLWLVIWGGGFYFFYSGFTLNDLGMV